MYLDSSTVRVPGVGGCKVDPWLPEVKSQVGPENMEPRDRPDS